MDINPEDFERFLRWLDPDRERACEQYEATRRKLTRFFVCRGWEVDAEQLADETINRVIIKMRVLADTYEGNRLPYFYGVARRVNQERIKKQIEEDEAARKLRAMPGSPVADASGERERLDHCLDDCMKGLSSGNRELIQKYYLGEKHEKVVHRKELADEVGIAPNALRIRAHRIRTDLRRCVEGCVENA